MGELSARVALLTNKDLEVGYAKKKPILKVLAKLLLKSLIWVIFLAWVAAIFFQPLYGRKVFSVWIKLTEGSVFGVTGSIFLAFSAPILAIAILAYIYVAYFMGENFKRSNYRFPRFRLWTHPVLVDGPFGVVSAVEFIGIILFVIYVLWSVIVYLIHDHKLIESLHLTVKETSCFMLEITGLRLGSIGMFCLAFLFLPISRGSIILRMIDIPFEQATRYHVWLGHLTMAIFTLHGLLYVIAWAMQGKLLQEIQEWNDIGIANFPGVISLAAGLLMWVTSLRPVRRAYFELFFYTHQLYVIFIVFLALHVGDFIFSYAAGAIFLFVLDRFLRFCQSRTTVDVVSAVCRPCGIVELVLSKPPALQYNALSFIFIQVRELSWLQWHPFSVSSSPLDGKHHMSILIKVLGKWTAQLKNIISEQPQKDFQSKFNGISASIEGPYGHEMPYHLMYENLILVAGGIGISPFFAILSDILHLTGEGRPCIPKNILEDGVSHEKVVLPPPLISTSNPMSCLVGTGHIAWAGAYVLASTTGFILFYALLELYYLTPFQVVTWWYRGLLFTICMVSSVVILGGMVIFFWDKWEKRRQKYERLMENKDERKSTVNKTISTTPDFSKEDLSSVQTVHYGSRPDFRAIFSSYAERMGHVNFGVIVCGPPGLQCSVAKECSHHIKESRIAHPIPHTGGAECNRAWSQAVREDVDSLSPAGGPNSESYEEVVEPLEDDFPIMPFCQ
ncbi:hypothetical protein HPP92_011165 [Vanilla planifolia]|uniref:FAD-binding FR-type domain-containing protein n=1 Tax=Vanilla planifolia TaxID=51239 RepID=A0A835R077_VANPL|nr:hypothetical protein HPP92_011165 [Vanilla planifolia]